MKASCALLMALAFAGPAPAMDKAQVFAEVEKLAQLLSDGAAETDESSLILAEGPGPYLFAVFFEGGFDGGNGGLQYLAVFKQNVQSTDEVSYRVRPLQLVALTKVGEDYDRIFESIEVKGDRVMLAGKRWHDDAHCCPSQAVAATFRFDGNSIVELGTAKK